MFEEPDPEPSGAAPPGYGSLFAALYGTPTGEPFTAPIRVVMLYTTRLTKDGPAARLRVCDVRTQTEYETTLIHDPQILEFARDSLQLGEVLELEGRIVPQPGRQQDPEAWIAVDALRPLPRPSALLGLDPQLCARADAIIDQHAGTPGALHNYLLGQIHDHLELVTSGRSGRFRQCEKAVLLQALSHGQVNPAVNGRLSVLLCSRPGSSKKMMALMALVLAPIGQLIQPTMVSPAGLAARVEQTRTGWKASPGALPKNSDGVVVIEDMHRLPRNQSELNTLHGCLAAVAEDGKVMPVKAAQASYRAMTALHINTNMSSLIHAELRPAGVRAKLKDLGLPFDLLSRLDLILHLDSGDNAGKQARDIATQPAQQKKSAPERDAKQEQALLLQAIIARLLDRYAVVDLDPAKEAIGALMDDISLLIGDYSAKMTEEQQLVFDGEGLLRRMANSLRKLVSASARLDGRGYATAKDVDTAWDMLAFKLEVVRWICDDKAVRVQTIRSRKEAVDKARAAAVVRWDRIMLAYAGQDVVVAQVAAALGYSSRTVGRDMEAHGVYPDLGVCRVPTQWEWAQTEAALIRGEPLPGPERVISDEDYEAPEQAMGADGQPVVVPEDRPADATLLPVGPEYRPCVQAIDQVLDENEAMYAGETLLEAAVAYDPDVRETPMRLLALRGELERGLHEDAPYEAFKGLDDTFAVLQGPDQVKRTELALRLFLDSEQVVMTVRPMERALAAGEQSEAVLELAAEAKRIIEWRWDKFKRARAAQKAQEEEMRKREARVQARSMLL